MTVQAGIADELPFLRAEANARMVDTFAIRLPNGYTMVGDVETPAYTDLFTTPGRVKTSANVVRESEVGDRTAATVFRELHIPWDSPAVPANALAVCTAVDATSDPTLLNVVLRIDGASPGSQMTSRRLQVSEVLS